MIDTDYPYYPNCTSDEPADFERQIRRKTAFRCDFAARCFGIFGVLIARIWAKAPPSLIHLVSRYD